MLRYLRGASGVWLRYNLDKPVLEGLTDSNMLIDVDSSRSTFGYVMTYVGGAVSWKSRLQRVVALSTTEVEYMVVVEADKEIIWMRELIGELGIKHDHFLLHFDY